VKNIRVQPSQGNNHANDAKNNNAVDLEICPDSIKKTRKALGLTVDHFAWLFGVSPSSIFRYENSGVPTVHHGTITRKLHLLDVWLKDPDSLAVMTQLLMIKDGLPTLSGLLEMGGVLLVQDPAEARAANAKANQARNHAADSPDAAKAAPAETGKAKARLSLPLLTELAKRGFRSFNMAVGVLNADGLGIPQLIQTGAPRPLEMENESRQLEAEAQLIEAQARKLEAEARKAEAEARIAKAKKEQGSP
jgi:transcriptional regulator with XRE-family HTH domain